MLRHRRTSLRHVVKNGFAIQSEKWAFTLKINSSETTKHCFTRQQNTVGALVGRTQQDVCTTEQVLSIGQQEVLLLLKCTDVQILQRPAQLVCNIHLSDRNVQTKLDTYNTNNTETQCSNKIA